MLLKHVYLYLNLEEYPDDLTTSFGFRTRYVCNYLERRLHELKHRVEGFNKICVQGRHEPLPTCSIVPENAALPTVAFDEARYAALRSGDEHEFFIEMLLQGLALCAQEHPIPLTEMNATIEAFRTAGYRNEWTHQRKLLRPVGVHASLLCSLDAERFRLNLKLEKHGETVFDQVILETKPSELIFAHRFKQVVLENDAIVVKDKFAQPLFSTTVPPSIN